MGSDLSDALKEFGLVLLRVDDVFLEVLKIDCSVDEFESLLKFVFH